MRKTVFCMILLLFSAFCFAQQTPRITGVRPDPASNNQYRLQVGAYMKLANAASATAKLKRAGFTPSNEQYKNLTRVFIAGVKAKEVNSYIRRIANLGFREVYIAKDGTSSDTTIKKVPAIRKLVRDTIRITGIHPDPASNNQYRLQVGAFPAPADASSAFTRLKGAGFTPSKEPYKNLIRVFIAGVKAQEVNSYTRRIADLGFREVYITKDGTSSDTGAAIRETPARSKPAAAAAPVVIVKETPADSKPVVVNPGESTIDSEAVTATPPRAEATMTKAPSADSDAVAVAPPPVEEMVISELPPVSNPVLAFTRDEKWDIVSRDSGFISFEFTGDGHYIIVETSEGDKPIVHFGEYTMPDNETFDLAGLDTVTNVSIDQGVIQFTFDDTVYEAKEAEPIAVSVNTDMFCGTWKLQQIDDKDVRGTENELTILYSKAGTYLVSYPDGEVELAQWKWKDAAETEFLYSFHDWKSYGSAKINRSLRTALAFEDSGYDFSIDGYSAGDSISRYLFVPFKN